jgi:uncharacterized protein YbjT (DUF2867 family)
MRARRKIAVAGATGRVGRHVVDVVTGDGLAEALAGVESVVDVATGSSPDEDAATEFFTAAARNLHDAGERAGVRRMVVVSIIGSDRFSACYTAAKVAHERAMLSGRSRCMCCGRRSSTSSSGSSWSGAGKAR